ncbi:unnamed protein product [Effrenium voratum]|nr:unnamed protein product [Effrenium voratum]
MVSLCCWLPCRAWQARTRPVCRCDDCSRALFFLLSEGLEILGPCCVPELLVSLGMCNRRLRAAILADCGFEGTRQLAFAAAAGHLCQRGNFIYFSRGGGVVCRESLDFLSRAARVAKRFRAKVHIDAHAGVHAPGRLLAKSVSETRVQAVLLSLAHEGLSASQITFTAWGKEIALAWPDECMARAELFFQLGDREIPPRPRYYQSRSCELRDGPICRGDVGSGCNCMLETAAA